MEIYRVVCGAEQTGQSGWGIWLLGAGHRPGLKQGEKHFSMSEIHSSITMEGFLPCLAGCVVSISHTNICPSALLSQHIQNTFLTPLRLHLYAIRFLKTIVRSTQNSIFGFNIGLK